MKDKQLICYTVGHSNIEMQVFLKTLGKYQINCLVDVRSSPYSKYVPQYNKENLSKDLKRQDILYVYMGNRLGGRYSEANLLFSDGKVNYNKVRQTQNFQNGIQTVIRNIQKGLTIALMCAEKNPLDCHRFVLVSKSLSEQGVLVQHIMANGELCAHNDLEGQLVQKYSTESDQLTFIGEDLSKQEMIEQAYCQRNAEIAYTAELET